MKKKTLNILTIGLVILILTGCGAPKLEDRQEKSNYSAMKNGSFKAKYTNLDNVEVYYFNPDKKYPNNKAMQVFEKDTKLGYNGYNIIINGSNDDIKAKTGTIIKEHDKLKINKAEVVSESLNNKDSDPTLLVNESDIELIDENKLQSILESDKSYQELEDESKDSNCSLYIMKLKDKEIYYDPKYSERVATLIKQYDEIQNEYSKNDKAKMDSMYSNMKVAQNKEEAIKEVETMAKAELNAKFSGKYKIQVYDTFIGIDFDNSIKLSDINIGELTNITRKIYGYYTDSGLARTETKVNTISIFITVQGKKFTSYWSLGSSPVDDWNK